MLGGEVVEGLAQLPLELADALLGHSGFEVLELEFALIEAFGEGAELFQAIFPAFQVQVGSPAGFGLPRKFLGGAGQDKDRDAKGRDGQPGADHGADSAGT